MNGGIKRRYLKPVGYSFGMGSKMETTYRGHVGDSVSKDVFLRVNNYMWNITADIVRVRIRNQIKEQLKEELAG